MTRFYATRRALAVILVATAVLSLAASLGALFTGSDPTERERAAQTLDLPLSGADFSALITIRLFLFLALPIAYALQMLVSTTRSGLSQQARRLWALLLVALFLLQLVSLKTRNPLDWTLVVALFLILVQHLRLKAGRPEERGKVP